MLVLQQVVGLRGRQVHERHARFHAVLDVQVAVQVGDRPEVDQMHGRVARTDAVDAAEPLDDAHRVPVDVVVDEQVAVLQVLPFRNAVGRDQHVDFRVLRKVRLFGAAFRARAEVGENLVVVRAAQRRGVAAVAADQRDMAAAAPHRGAQVGVEIARGVGERGEDQHLAVLAPVHGGRRGRPLGGDDIPQPREFRVAGDRDDRGHLQQVLQLAAVAADRVAPRRHVDVAQVELAFAADRKVVRARFRVVQVAR